jgi:hypothetical protein
MLEADRAEVGWESPEDWEFDSETLASKIAKLKKKQDGEVEKSTPHMQLWTWKRKWHWQHESPRPSAPRRSSPHLRHSL